FNLDEPWDGPTNKRLIAQMPRIYEVPGRQAPPGMTYYQVFTGPDAPFEGTRKTRIANIPDGLSNTILVAEAAEPVVWTRPEDLAFTRDGPLPKLLDEFLVAMMDGAVRPVNRKKTSDQTQRLAVMPADGQPLPPDW